VIFGGFPALLTSGGDPRIWPETKLRATARVHAFQTAQAMVSEAVMAIRRIAPLTMETAILRQYSHMLSVMLQVLIKSFSWILLLFSFPSSWS